MIAVVHSVAVKRGNKVDINRFCIIALFVCCAKQHCYKRTKRHIRNRNRLILFTRVRMFCSFRAVSLGTTHIHISTYTGGSTVFPNCATYS